MKVKEESEKVGLKLNIKKTKCCIWIMASGPIISWEIDGETVSDFIFGGSKITSDGDCSHEVKRCLLLGWKVMTNLDSILKSRDITLPTKVHLVKAMVFPVIMYGCESWTVKKAECQKIDPFWIDAVVLEKTLESPLDSKKIQPVHPKGDQSWVFIGRTDAEAEAPILSTTSCQELTHWKRPWCWEGLGTGGEGDDRGWDGWMASLTRWTWVWVYSGSWRWTGRPGLLRFMGSQKVGHNLATELNWIWFRWHLDKTWDLELMMEWLRCLDVVIGHMYFAYENVNFRGLESGVLWAGLCILKLPMSFPSGDSGKELACQGRRHETQIWFLGWKDPLEKEMATHSSIVAWWSLGTEKLGGLQSIGSQRIIHDWSNLAGKLHKKS